ncbi:MAG: peptidoglycan-associated lipoprotein, partial [Acetobacteraceae bacterium]
MFRIPAALALVTVLAACGSDSTTSTGNTAGLGNEAALGQSGSALGGAGGAGGAGGRAAAGPGSQEDLVANIGDRVFFVTDSASVGADQRPVLARQAAWLQQYRQLTIAVEGHADERGTREYNLALGQRRANAARDILVSQGVAGSRIQTISFGKDRPAAL